jgi:hypothetical protein
MDKKIKENETKVGNNMHGYWVVISKVENSHQNKV